MNSSYWLVTPGNCDMIGQQTRSDIDQTGLGTETMSSEPNKFPSQDNIFKKCRKANIQAMSALRAMGKVVLYFV